MYFKYFSICSQGWPSGGFNRLCFLRDQVLLTRFKAGVTFLEISEPFLCYLFIDCSWAINTSLNKSQAGQIDGTTNKKNPYDFYKVLTFKSPMSKFEPSRMFTNYSYLSEVTVANFQNNAKIWIPWVDKALLSDGKNIIQAKQWLD